LAIAELKVSEHLDHSGQSARRLKQLKLDMHAFNKPGGALASRYREALLPYFEFRTSTGRAMVSIAKFKFPERGTSRIRE
jgi:hypothetical protein